MVVDLDRFDQNGADIVRRAHAKPVRCATKSLRVRSLITRALERVGSNRVMAFALPEAIWLAHGGHTDVLAFVRQAVGSSVTFVSHAPGIRGLGPSRALSDGAAHHLDIRCADAALSITRELAGALPSGMASPHASPQPHGFTHRIGLREPPSRRLLQVMGHDRDRVVALELLHRSPGKTRSAQSQALKHFAVVHPSWSRADSTNTARFVNFPSTARA